MSRVGVYVVDSAELDKPPGERTHEQIGAYDRSAAQWTDSTDSRLPIALPEEEDPYTATEIQKEIESTTVHVYREHEVPGTVDGLDSAVRGHGPASD